MVAVLFGGLVAAACGDNSRVINAATVQSEATVVGLPSADTVPDSTALTTQTPAQPDTTLPLGGVSIDDPLPAQTDAATDPVVAEAAVRYAYQHWILIDLDKHLRASLIENGESNVDAIDSGIHDAQSVIEFGRIQVETVQFSAADRADVTFHVQWQGGPSPYFPDLMSGTAVMQDGTWRISGHTLCLLAFGAGQDCAGSDTAIPTPAEALVLLGAPPQFTWLGGTGQPNVVTVPGTCQWDGAGAGGFSITTEALAGVAALDLADAEALLSTRRYLGPDSLPYPVGGRPGRIIDDGTHVQLVYIRPDDIVVRIDANGLTATQVTEVAFALAPASSPTD